MTMKQQASRPGATPRARRGLLSRAALATAVVAGALGLTAPSPGEAAVTHTLTVTTLAYAGDDAAPGDGTCAVTGGGCSLRAAIQEANALDVGAGDTVLINFAPGLTGFIVGPDGNTAANRMKVGTIVPGWDVSGAYYHLAGRMTVDFDNRVGFTQIGDQGTGFFIDGPDITLRNFDHGAVNPPGSNGNRTVKGLTAGETAIVVSANAVGTTLEDGAIVETGRNWLERGIIPLSGAHDLTIRNVEFGSFEDLGGAIRILADAQLDRLVLDGVTMQNDTPESFYYGLYAEPRVVLDDLSITDSTFRDWRGNRILYLNGATVDGLRVADNTFENYNTTITRYALDFERATVTDAVFERNTFDRLDADRIINLYRATVNRLRFSDNAVTDITDVSFNVFDLRAANLTDLTFIDNTFDGIRVDGGWRIWDLSGGVTSTNLVIRGNTFTDIAGSGSFVDSRDSNQTGLSIDHNTFTRTATSWSILDIRGGNIDTVNVTDNVFTDTSAGYPAVWTNRISPNSHVARNRWVNPDATKKYGWIFVFDNGSVPATTVAGWQVHDNHVQVASSNAEAPVRIGSGYLPVERNTFGSLNRGTTPTEDGNANSETGASWFVWNVGANANGKLRTWYPNAVSIDASTERARVTVQPPAANETPAPATPVSVDVYYTPGAGGQRQADRYLGRVVGLTGQSTFDLNCGGCSSGGYIRVQTLSPTGATTQYSRIVQALPGTVPAAPLATDLEDGDEVPVGSTISGTGTPGATVEVVNTDTDEVLCTTVVAESGLWSCQVDFDATQGPGTIVANELEEGTVVDSSEPVEVEVVPAPVTLAIAPADEVPVGSTVSGTGSPGTTVQVRNVDADEVLCTATVAADGTWSCTVDPDATQGPATLVAEELDGNGDPVRSSAPVEVELVGPIVLPGSAVDDEGTYAPGEATTIDPLANDVDPTGTAFDPTTVVLLDAAGDPQTTLVVAGEGTYVVDPDSGEITFTPEAGFGGPTTPVTYRVNDGIGNTYEAQVTLTEAPVVGVSMVGPGAVLALLALGGLAAARSRRRRPATA